MIKRLIKDYDKPQNPEVRVRVGRFAGFIGILANAVLFAVKLVFGLISGSISIIADSLNNLSDSGSNVLTVVGYTISGKPADKDHPYGHARMEYLASLFISIIVTFLGFEMLSASIEKLVGEPEAKSYSILAIVVMASTILVKIFVAVVGSLPPCHHRQEVSVIGAILVLELSVDSHSHAAGADAALCRAGLWLAGESADNEYLVRRSYLLMRLCAF
jgi:cation diffusion facilitator family transporter